MNEPLSLSFFGLPYTPDSAHWFSRIRTAGNAVWLDSNHTHHGDADHTIDLMSAGPIDWVTSTEAGKALDSHGKLIAKSTSIEALQTFIARYQPDHHIGRDLNYPCPGFFGFLSYEAGHELQYLDTPTTTGEPTLPLIYFGFYPWVLINDHKTQQCNVMYAEQWVSEQTIRDYLDREPTATEPFGLDTPWQPKTTKDQYKLAIASIHDYLEAGDCYQVNLAQCFSARYRGDPFYAYQKLRRAYPAPYSAFIEIADACVLSVSPELFLRVRDQEVTTKPIKGTRPRSKCQDTDRAIAQALSQSSKDRAENVMIVDLMRNDLARCCVPGSISVPSLFDVEHYQAVHHLVSTITGQLRPECTAIDLLSATFPGGSITGAPKRRAMEIIHELEANPRQVYCGSIGRIGLDHSADFNIAIRTATCYQTTISVWGGGGIVMDSEADAEFQESLDKIGAILDCLSLT